MTGGDRLDDLDLLVRVVRAGSIGQAANDLRLPQPTVSRRLARLERSLGVTLLTRSKRGTTPTQAGAAVVDWAKELLDAAERFAESVQLLREQTHVSTRVAVSMTVAEHYAPRWLAALPGEELRSDIALTVENSATVTELVDTGQADLGFIESPVVTHGLDSERVGWDAIAVAVRPAHPWAGRGPISPAELAATPLLVREAGSGTRETLERALARHGLALTVGLVLPSNTALTSAAVAGIGPVVVSERAVQGELAAGQLALVPVAGLDVRRPLTAVWHADRRLPPAASALVAVAAGKRAPR